MSKMMEAEAAQNRKVAQDLLKKIPKGGLAEIRLKNPKKTGSIGVRGYTYTDPETNTRSYREFLDSGGNARIVKYTKKVTLNMDNDDDRLEYFHVLNHPVYSHGANAVLKVVYLEKEAEDNVNKRDRQADVTAIVRKLSGESLRDFARVVVTAGGMRYNPRTTENALKNSIYELSDRDPDLVLEEFNHKDRSIKELIYKAKEKEIITLSNGVWKFNNEVIGRNFEQAIDWFKRNEEVLPALRKELK